MGVCMSVHVHRLTSIFMHARTYGFVLMVQCRYYSTRIDLSSCGFDFSLSRSLSLSLSVMHTHTHTHTLTHVHNLFSLQLPLWVEGKLQHIAMTNVLLPSLSLSLFLSLSFSLSLSLPLFSLSLSLFLPRSSVLSVMSPLEIQKLLIVVWTTHMSSPRE